MKHIQYEAPNLTPQQFSALAWVRLQNEMSVHVGVLQERRPRQTIIDKLLRRRLIIHAGKPSGYDLTAKGDNALRSAQAMREQINEAQRDVETMMQEALKPDEDHGPT